MLNIVMVVVQEVTRDKRNEWNNTQHNRNSIYYLFNINFDNCNINSNIR